MRLVERLGEDTEAFHEVTDEEVFRLLGSVTPADYHRYLIQMYGFVRPLERSISNTPEVDRYLDLRGFQKHELLRRDLMAFHMTSDEIARLPECAVPWFATPEEALGWAYPLERSTLRHGDLFRHLASILPGEVAFASSYLKCYFGVAGDAWSRFGSALDAFESAPERARQVIESAKVAFRCLRAWRARSEQDGGMEQLASLHRRPPRPGGSVRFRWEAAPRVRNRS